MYPKIQYISQGISAKEQLLTIQKMLDSGIQWVQLRYKNVPEIEMYRLAESVKKSIENYECKFIINDFISVAKAVDADGVHLGLTDEAIEKARFVLGENAIIGGTSNTLFDVVTHKNKGCNYVGLGPYAFTTTKEKLSPILGIEGYQNILQNCAELEIDIPIYAIGGIQQNDVEKLISIGVHGIAISGLLTQANHPEKILSQLNELYYEAT